jgi:cytoskeletal protein CcmA (bactofilin family)
MDEQKPNNENSLEDNSLESNETVVENSGNTQDASTNSPAANPADEIKVNRSIAEKIQRIIGGLNIYLLLFIMVILLAGFATFASFQASKKQTDTTIDSKELSQEDLEALKNSDANVGDAKQTLTIASNAVFNGRVLVRDSLDVAGTIRVGGTLALPGITVSGTSAFQNVQVGNNLSVAGNSAVQGQLTVQRDFTVGGNATVAGTITAQRLNIDRFTLNGDLQLNRHIDAGGPIPRISSGTAVGGAGTVSISGSDTAGTVNVNFGFGTVGGIIASVTFGNAFTQTPHVVITPVGSNCANLNFYVNRTTGGFSIGTTNAGPQGTSCAFDYIAID